MSYSGDGTLSTNIGSISGTTLSVTDEDGIFSGVVTATAGTSYAATSLNFSYNTEKSGGKAIPTITLTPYPDASSTAEYIYSSDGDGEITAFKLLNGGSVDNCTVRTSDNHILIMHSFSGAGTLYVLSSETDSFSACYITLNVT